jgi:hypothetical protein
MSATITSSGYPANPGNAGRLLLVNPFTWLATGVDRLDETVIVKLLPSAHPCKRGEGSGMLTQQGKAGK